MLRILLLYPFQPIHLPKMSTVPSKPTVSFDVDPVGDEKAAPNTDGLNSLASAPTPALGCCPEPTPESPRTPVAQIMRGHPTSPPPLRPTSRNAAAEVFFSQSFRHPWTSLCCRCCKLIPWRVAENACFGCQETLFFHLHSPHPDEEKRFS